MSKANSSTIRTLLEAKDNILRFYNYHLYEFYDLTAVDLPVKVSQRNYLYLTRRIFENEAITFDDQENINMPIGELRHLLSLGVSVGFLFTFPTVASIEMTPAFISIVRKPQPLYRGIRTVLQNDDIVIKSSGISSMLILNRHSEIISWEG